MERGEIDDPDAPPDNRTLGERLDELCLYYMAMGVPYDEFWYGDYCALKYYEAAYLRKRKVRNEEFWMQGVYNFAAHQTTLGNIFRGRGHKAQEYLQKPISFFPKTAEELQEEERQKRKQTVEYLNAFKKAWDAKHGRSS